VGTNGLLHWEDIHGSGRRPRLAPYGVGVDTTEVREWAGAQGIEVKDRGRVLAELVVKFKAATAQQRPVRSGSPGL
jgi:hypothetical protein